MGQFQSRPVAMAPQLTVEFRQSCQSVLPPSLVIPAGMGEEFLFLNEEIWLLA